MLIYRAKQFMTIKKDSKKSLYILEDAASGVQVGVLNKQLSRICLEYNNYTKLLIFYKILWRCPQVDNEINEYEKKPNLKIVNVYYFQPFAFENHF